MNGGVTIELAGDHWDGQGLDVSTTNGGLHVKVPQSYSAQLDLSTHNGSIRADLPELQTILQSEEVRRSKHVAAAMGRGGAVVKLATTNGGVSVSH
jgi:DUF4097 and DUF4098 domain-containing protein YvlB